MANNYSKLPVMVVEDYQSSMSQLSLLLARKGFKNLVLMLSSRNALNYLKECDVATILIDLDLPFSNGVKLLKLITNNKPHIPIVVVTEVNEIDTAVECIKLGAFDFLTKPVSLDRLADSVTKALDFRCLKEVASLLPGTPCKHGSGILSDACKERAPVPFTLPVNVPEWLRKAVDCMDLNLSKPLSLGRIAQKACLSKYHFSRKFKKYIGTSPIQFMRNRRICQAILLLQNTELSISSVAIRSGFNDQSEFTKWFKKATGFTPSWYKKSFVTRD
jgi:AraC-like DNA-binding protein/ActR/RegA family two-component response regulator